eukprot:gene6288-6524_t
MAELGTLRSAKQALSEQLITQQDFDCVKVAFLRAQQIKAGLDAGFIRKEDYDRAVEAYLHAMDFQLIAATPSMSAPPSVNTNDEPGSCVEIPADLPDYCKGATAGKKSMSGIGIDESCVNLFMHMKTKSMYKWLIFKVDGSGRMVVPEKVGGQTSTYNELVCSLPDGQCRYAVYDYEYKSPERGTFKKLVFLLWAPEHSGIKPKMMYASTKDFFKGFLDGIGAELQANEPSELSEGEIRERVLSNMTRK